MLHADPELQTIPEKAAYWSYIDNCEFYETKKLHLTETCQKAGLSDCSDVKHVEPYIKTAANLLDVGCGYGRAIDYLTRRRPDCDIHGVDLNQFYCETLQERYRDNTHVTISHIDVFKLDAIYRYDVIMHLWSGISDFAPQDQARLLVKYAQLIKSNGLIIIDTLIHDLPASQQVNGADKYYVINDEGVTIRGYKPEPYEIKQYCEDAGLVIQKHIIYESAVKPRNLFIITPLN